MTTIASRFRSLFVKCALIMIVTIGVVAAVLTYLSFQTAREIGYQAVTGRAQQVTRMLTQSSVGALRFGKFDTLSGRFDDMVFASNENAIGAIAIGLDGKIVAGASGREAENLKLRDLAQKALDTGVDQTSADGLSVADVVTDITNGSIVGVIATHWSTHTEEAVIKRGLEQVFLFGSVTFALALALSILFIRQMVTLALERLGTAMRGLAEKDYSVLVPGQSRGDEIGAIARTLEALRETLAAGELAAIEAAYKGAAFEDSSAAMMLVDQDMRVKFLNPRMLSLLEEMEDDLRVKIPGFEAHSIVGKHVDQFHPQPELRARIGNIHDVSGQIQLAIGERRIRLRVARVHDVQGEVIGRVVEWTDITQEALNGAVIAALNSDQARAEFDERGKLLLANARFSTPLGQEPATLLGRDFSSILDPAWAAENGGTGFLDRIRSEGRGRARCPSAEPPGLPSSMAVSVLCVMRRARSCAIC
ncbi:HAMP domain-containing protein [Thioclava sp. BHET1]|nr:HAMP domain-containing protein [Thioclava sp. BHET1]